MVSFSVKNQYKPCKEICRRNDLPRRHIYVWHLASRVSKTSWASVVKMAQSPPQCHHRTCGQRGERPKSNHGQTMADRKTTWDVYLYQLKLKHWRREWLRCVYARVSCNQFLWETMGSSFSERRWVPVSLSDDGFQFLWETMGSSFSERRWVPVSLRDDGFLRGLSQVQLVGYFLCSVSAGITDLQCRFGHQT